MKGEEGEVCVGKTGWNEALGMKDKNGSRAEETAIGADGMNEGLGMGDEVRMVEHKSDCEHFLSLVDSYFSLI